jgi:anti-sigma B factor antagonist
MNFLIDKTDTYSVLLVQSERLDSTISPQLKSELVVMNAEGVNNIIIDLQKTKYCDSSGLSSILVANRLCKNAGGIFVLCSISDSVKKLIAISQLDSILNIVENVDEAIQFIESEKVN